MDNWQIRKSALGRLLKPFFDLDEVEFPTENVLSPLKEGSNEVITGCDYYLVRTRALSQTY